MNRQVFADPQLLIEGQVETIIWANYKRLEIELKKRVTAVPDG
jgi:hypothetical protein